MNPEYRFFVIFWVYLLYVSYFIGVLFKFYMINTINWITHFMFVTKIIILFGKSK